MGIRDGIRALAVSAALITGAHATASGASDDLVDTAVKAGNFSTLASALTEAGLVDGPARRW